MADAPKDFFEVQDCINCGVRFGVPFGFTQYRRDDKRAFYCPNGHSMSYRESDLDVMRRERDRLKQENARLAQEANENAEAARRAEAEAVRLKKRAGAGVCPCCNRTFKQLADHMKRKHPEVVPISAGAKPPPRKRAQSS